MPQKPYVQPETLKKLLEYNPVSGALFWKARTAETISAPSRDPEHACKAWNEKFAGKRAFTANRCGYLVGNIFGRTYPAHRVAWAIHFGAWPKGDIDHIDGNRGNNSLTNLRDVPRVLNMRNMKMSRHNTTGFTGVYRNTHTRKWSAKIWLNNKSVHIGYFDTAEEAAAARKQAQIANGFTASHGVRK